MVDEKELVTLQAELEIQKQRAEEAERRLQRIEHELTAARQQETLFRSRFEAFMADVPCVLWENWFQPDPSQGRTSYCNDYVKTLLGVEPEEWVMPGFWTRCIHPEDKERMVSDHTLFAEGGGVREWRALTKDGRTIWITNLMKVLSDGEGRVVGLRGVTMDVTELKLAQQERENVVRYRQDLIIQNQKAALAELSSPLIPITDDILVLPIIGSLDTERGQQVLETALHGSSRSRARVAIIDITGVRTVDTQAASALTNAAQALRLLGVTPILTGIRPEVAQALVSIGVSLDRIATLSTLQAGIQYALRHLGKPLHG